MDDRARTQADLIEENRALRQRIVELEARVAAQTAAQPSIDPDASLSWLRQALDASRSAESALRVSEENLQTIIGASPDIIKILDSRGHILWESAAISELLGYSSEERRGHPMHDLVHPEDREFVDAALDKLLTRQVEAVQLRYRARHAIEGWITLEAHGRAIHTDSEMAAVLVARDISEHVRLEEALRQAKEAAELSNYAKTEFLSRMSHELRTPLNAILGFAQLLEMGTLTRKQRESIDHILKAGQHLLNLINEVLDIARIEAGRVNLSIEPVFVADVLQEALDLAHRLAAQRSIPIEIDDQLGENWVLADRQRFRQVLLNLLTNAIKYNRAAGHVHIFCEQRAHHWLRLCVADTGPGLAAEQQARLFIPFERLQADMSSVEGTGLGLALSKRLVEVMGGAIGVESQVGQGCTFWVELPLAAGPPDAPVPDGEERMVEAIGARGVYTILYIEDNPSNLVLVEHIVSQRPELRLLTATNGQRGVQLAREHRPDMIVLDLHLPDLNGDEVLHQLKGEPHTREIPVVMLSADATLLQIERLRAAGVHDYLTKPLNVRRFLETLNTVLRGSNAD